jgi:hypothetical protein
VRELKTWHSALILISSHSTTKSSGVELTTLCARRGLDAQLESNDARRRDWSLGSRSDDRSVSSWCRDHRPTTSGLILKGMMFIEIVDPVLDGAEVTVRQTSYQITAKVETV